VAVYRVADLTLKLGCGGLGCECLGCGGVEEKKLEDGRSEVGRDWLLFEDILYSEEVADERPTSFS